MSGVLLACSRRALVASRRHALPTLSSDRWYSSTRPVSEEEAAATNKNEDNTALREAARDFNSRNATYKRQVSKLRKDYLGEYLRHKAEDQAQRDAEEAEKVRHHLERQRAKNERSVQNAMRQQELRRQTKLAFEDHLRVQQEKRDAEKKLFTRARQLLIDELEEEAHLWLTTAEEVESAFSPEAEQLLWARPQGVLGVPNPSLDSHFWQYECHTWDMSKTYKTQKDLLLEEFEDEVYNRTNIDPDFWSPERLHAREVLERKAKLRANVRVEGRKSLLLRQKEYLDEEAVTEEGELPKPTPVPSVGVLSDINAQEKEGAELLFKDPTKFFVFDRSQGAESAGDDYSGPSLGTPVDLKDPLRAGGRVFPLAVGKLPKPDMRSAKEKKRQEREEKLWAAAQEKARADMSEIDLAAEEDVDFGEPLDYDNNEDWDSDDEEWLKGLDTERDADLINMPREYRYREEDIDWVIEKLESKAKQMQSHVRNAVETMEQEARSRLENRENVDKDGESTDFFDDATKEVLQSAGADVGKFESLMSSLTEDQLLSLFALEAKAQETGTEETKHIFENIPGLSDDQVSGLKELEAVFLKAESEDDQA